jgi:hypothetical protein
LFVSLSFPCGLWVKLSYVKHVKGYASGVGKIISQKKQSEGNFIPLESRGSLSCRRDGEVYPADSYG